MEEKKKSSLPIILAILGGAIIIGVFILVGIKMSSPKEEAKQEEVKKEDTQKEDTKEDIREPETDEEKEALGEAKAEIDQYWYSKKGLLEILSYDYDGAVAKYAVDNCGADFKEEALEAAEYWLDDEFDAYSEISLAKKLKKENGFTEEETEYAIENCGADFKEQALERAQMNAYYDCSKKDIEYDLTNESFTEDEIRYALDNIDVDFKTNAIMKAYDYADEGKGENEIRAYLKTDGFTDEEIEYAINNM